MKRIEYEENGRKYQIEVSDTAEEEDYHLYPVIGPPDVVDVLELPEPFATHLHNELYYRGIFTASDANIQLLTGALQKALKIDAQILHAAIINYEKEPEIIQEV